MQKNNSLTHSLHQSTHQADNCAGLVGSGGVLVGGCACIYVCLSVTGLWLKYTSFMLDYIPHCLVCVFFVTNQEIH